MQIGHRQVSTMVHDSSSHSALWETTLTNLLPRFLDCKEICSEKPNRKKNDSNYPYLIKLPSSVLQKGLSPSLCLPLEELRLDNISNHSSKCEYINLSRELSYYQPGKTLLFVKLSLSFYSTIPWGFK